MEFKQASKEQAKLRMALIGPAGSGKTYTALAVAQGFGKKIALIDTERGSASKYAGIFKFDTLQLESFSPANYILAIQAAQDAGYDVLIIDSLSHEWNGKDGALEMVNRAQEKSTSGNSYAAWKDVTPAHNKLTDAIIGAKCHVISTMRAKMEYVLEANEKGKMVPRKVGMGPVQRDGQEYEYDIVGELTMKNSLTITKTRCPALSEGYFEKPGKELAKILKDWLTDGVKPTEKPAPATESPKQPETPSQASLPPAKQAATAPTEPPKQEIGGEIFTIKGILENVIEKAGKYGVKLLGKKQYFVTYSQPAFIKALEMKGKRVKVSYKVVDLDGKSQYNLFGIKTEEKVNV